MPNLQDKRTFLIVGYPRSRTAWLANWLTWDKSFCYHEEARNHSSPKSFKNKLQNTRGTVIGDSASVLLLVLDSVLKAMPNTRLVAIKRKEEEVYRSLEIMTGGADPSMLMDRMREPFKRLLDMAGKVVEYDNLSNLDELKDLWEYCTYESIRFPMQRTILMQDMNITVPLEKRMNVGPIRSWLKKESR